MKASKKLVELMKQSQAKDTKPFDTQGEVVRVEGDIAWVHFAGGVDETPVRMTVNAEVGDNVQVRVSGGDAFLVGNGTAPPTDDKKANQAIASIKPVADAAEESRNLLGEMKTAAEEAGTTLTQIYQDAVDAKEASEEAQESAAQAAISASNASASASSAAADASSAATSANAAGESASQAQAASEAAQLAALSSITTDTLHYLATSQASGVTTQTAGWTTTVQTMTSTDKYLWTYHTYTAANGSTVDSTPVITGTYGQDGTSVTILGSYNTLAELQAAHPTGSRGDSYMVAGDLYVWNGSAWENVGQIQGPQGPQGATGDDGVSVTAVQPQYYLSTSSSSATGGSWSNSLSYVTGKYIWTRDRIAYSNNTTGYSTAIYNSALTDACKDAAEALGLIEEHQEWFWHDALGAHVLGETSGFKNDLTGTGMTVVDTSDNDAEVAHFGANGAQLGKDGTSRFLMQPTSLEAYDSSNVKYFEVTPSKLDFTGTMSANRIKSGLITDESGKNSWNLDTGDFSTKKGKIADFVISNNALSRTTSSQKFLLDGWNLMMCNLTDAYNNQYQIRGLDFASNGFLNFRFQITDNDTLITPRVAYYLWVNRYSSSRTDSELILGSYYTSGSDSNYIEIKPPDVSSPIQLLKHVYISKGLQVSGTKSRVVKTDDYSERLLYCYETPTPLFGDIGEAVIDADGYCYIDIDDIFSETIAEQVEYQVFLQKEGSGDCWIADKQQRYFVIQGTPNLKVAWELKAKQRDYNNIRLEPREVRLDEYDYTNDINISLEDYINEQEVLLYG